MDVLPEEIGELPDSHQYVLIEIISPARYGAESRWLVRSPAEPWSAGMLSF
jgi:hypothetical protein